MRLVKCLTCKGQGKIRSPLTQTKINQKCPVCKGHGDLLIPNDKAICPICKGSGSVLAKAAGLPFKEECTNCSGTGLVDIQQKDNQLIELVIFLLYMNTSVSLVFVKLVCQHNVLVKMSKFFLIFTCKILFCVLKWKK